ncbi:hypothetical protein IF1G_03542 [Cordyceps javanica]|uniref:Uncharacterized protein n=1 Tax=Cordyceps javanica TaxID=43265 RepID=A0A545V7W4_9HYPO|nr:hypothetical protein IF1G_03542 [Cordyceps javanica]
MKEARFSSRNGIQTATEEASSSYIARLSGGHCLPPRPPLSCSAYSWHAHPVAEMNAGKMLAWKQGDEQLGTQLSSATAAGRLASGPVQQVQCATLIKGRTVVATPPAAGGGGASLTLEKGKEHWSFWGGTLRLMTALCTLYTRMLKSEPGMKTRTGRVERLCLVLVAFGIGWVEKRPSK